MTINVGNCPSLGHTSSDAQMSSDSVTNHDAIFEKIIAEVLHSLQDDLRIGAWSHTKG